MLASTLGDIPAVWLGLGIGVFVGLLGYCMNRARWWLAILPLVGVIIVSVAAVIGWAVECSFPATARWGYLAVLLAVLNVPTLVVWLGFVVPGIRRRRRQRRQGLPVDRLPPWQLPVAILLSIIGYFVFAHWPRESKLIVSPETTVFTGPLQEGGTVDYVTAINERNSEGVTPANNAALPLLKALGPAVFAQASDPALLQERTLFAIGMESLPADGEYFVAIDEFTLSLQEAGQYEDVLATDMPHRVREADWSAAETAIISQWLAANDQPLALLIEASARERFYLPHVAGQSPTHLLVAQTAWLQLSGQDGVEALAARAILAGRAGRPDDAIADILAVRRLGALVWHPRTFLGMFVPESCDYVAWQATRALLSEDKLPAAAARRLLAEMPQQASMPSVAEMLQQERLMALDCAMMIARDGFGYGRSSMAQRLKHNILDGNMLISRVKDVQDRLIECVATDDEAEAQRRYDALESEIKKGRGDAISTIMIGTVSVLGGRPTRRGFTNIVADRLNWILLPTVDGLMARRHEAQARIDVVRIALALRLYQAEHGDYPASLEALAPTYLSAVPVDPCGRDAVVYRRDNGGWTVYSLGRNKADDGGRGWMDEAAPADADDIGIVLK